MEDYEMKLKTELEEETHKWHSRWPEPEECCMILKLELSRAQAELNAAYQRVEKQFADMELVKPDNTLVDIPCPPRPVHGRGLKIERRSREVGQEIIGDLIAFEDVIPKENGTGNEVPEQTYSADLEDLLTDCQKDSMEGNVAVETRNSDILVDLSAGSTAETSESNTIPKVASTSDDLSVLVTDFPISIMREEGNYCVPETPAIREIEDTVSLLSQYFNQVIKQRFESSDQALQDKETELADLNKVLILMQPLHDIGLAIRKRQVEIDSSKPREQKDQNIIAKGNSAAHHAQVLADATWTMDTTGEAQFQEMYGGISAKIVWERRDFTTFLDILNWNLNMRLFKPTGGLNRTTFGKLFKVVYSRIYPSFEITDKDFEEDRNLKNWLADMRAEHDVANERDRQTRATNRLFLRNQRGMAQQKSKGN
jgi:hypothetical protein